MNKYIIFERNLEIKNSQIISWAPESTKGRPNGLPWWREVKNIKKGDKIYFVSDTYLVAIGEATGDAKDYNHSDLFAEPKGNPDWNEFGYGVISNVITNYRSDNICITKELEKRLNNNNIRPFELSNGKVKAHQGGYCYPLSSELESLIIDIISNYTKIKTSKITNSKFTYAPIDLSPKTRNYGTSEISYKKIMKGKDGENKVKEFLNSLDLKTDDVSENNNNVADLVINDNHTNYSLEVKNISNQDSKHYIYLKDTQISALMNGETRLCLYFEGEIYLSLKSCKETFFKDIMNAINQTRKYVIDSFEGKFLASDLAILIDSDIIENNFILINTFSKEQLIEELK